MSESYIVYRVRRADGTWLARSIYGEDATWVSDRHASDRWSLSKNAEHHANFQTVNCGHDTKVVKCRITKKKIPPRFGVINCLVTEMKLFHGYFDIVAMVTPKVTAEQVAAALNMYDRYLRRKAKREAKNAPT